MSRQLGHRGGKYESIFKVELPRISRLKPSHFFD